MSHIIGLAETIEVTTACNLLEQYALNVLHYEVTTVVGATVTDANVADAMDALYAPLLKPMIPASCSYYGTKAQVILLARYDAQTSFLSQGPGTAVGDLLPTQSAGLVSWRTGFASRNRRGRSYLPASGEADNTNQAKPSAGYLTLMANWAAAYIAGITVVNGAGSVTLTPVIWSRETGLLTQVTSSIVRTQWATIRKRSHTGRTDVPPF